MSRHICSPRNYVVESSEGAVSLPTTPSFFPCKKSVPKNFSIKTWSWPSNNIHLSWKIQNKTQSIIIPITTSCVSMALDSSYQFTIFPKRHDMCHSTSLIPLNFSIILKKPGLLISPRYLLHKVFPVLTTWNEYVPSCAILAVYLSSVSTCPTHPGLWHFVASLSPPQSIFKKPSWHTLTLWTWQWVALLKVILDRGDESPAGHRQMPESSRVKAERTGLSHLIKTCLNMTF